ncbi:MAG TPA: bifunctional phosphoribosyl-AMP cyclohydrolase/phosphoribosyl-ATP diphosphatase HisIE [Chitinophagaceae bacterium]
MKPDFSKYADGLMPVIIQDVNTDKVLMLGFMNNEAYAATLKERRVVFYSRSKQRLWMKGETSGNYLHVKKIIADCDNDTLLIKVHPEGPVCHTGADTCFNEINKPGNFLLQLEEVIANRKLNPGQGSYTSSLFSEGINKVAQKEGEEAVEMIIEAKDSNEDRFLNESADLLFHYLVLLQMKGKTLSDVIEVLKHRSR